ncbi:MAG: baseplate J/gp47 family protein [Clostridiales Family XIII bacterium]|jgi:uncharacterized phage protein gp47/JayE|nr:baseplate J/gp47 family protein [Clostridiales Family XIII bacterium]
MFENVTGDLIMERMLARVPEHIRGKSIDKREGSIIYDALAPAAQELFVMYTCLDDIFDEAFADTAAREYLVRRASERGLAPFPATYAIWRGEFNMDVPIGSRFSIEDLDYVVIGKIEDFVFELQCETVGAVGNDYAGDLIPVEYIDGLEYAELTQLLIPGDDEEDTEKFRARYFESFKYQSFGGNIADYKSKVLAIPGVGAVNVVPVWDGGGTVKIVVSDSQYHAPTQTLIDRVQSEIDPGQTGLGYGLAPIGHVVTVEGVETTVVNLAALIEYETEYDWPAVQVEACAKLDDYYNELSRNFGSSQQIIIRISQIEIRLLTVKGIADIADTQINGIAANLVLQNNRLPLRGTFNGS